MSASPPPASLGPFQKGLLLAVAFALALALLVLRGGLQSESPLEQLARRSLDPDVALTNGQPTLIEFYADWCQACREMAPAMLSLEQSTRDRLDVVLVNVDNPRWLDLVDRYEVNGIPQLNLFAADGQPRGHSIGVRTPQELKALGDALINDNPVPALQGSRSASTLQDLARTDRTGPRSHG